MIFVVFVHFLDGLKHIINDIDFIRFYTDT